MSLFAKQDGYVGVDLGAHGVKIVELKNTKGRPQLWTYAIAHASLDIHPPENEAFNKPVDENIAEYKELTHQQEEEKKQKNTYEDNKRIDAYAKLIRQALHQARVTSRKAIASLPVSQVFHAIVTLPQNTEKNLDHHVRAKIKKMLPLPIEKMQVVHQKIESPEDKKNRFIRLLVTAAPKSLVTFYSQIFSKAGLQLDELETEAFALERSLVGRDLSTVMIIDIGGERTNFFIMDNGLPLTHRSIHLGGDYFDKKLGEIWQVDASLISQVKRDISSVPASQFDQELVTPLVDPIIKEISYSMDMFNSQTGNEQRKLEKIILTGGSSLFPPVISEIEKHFPVKVFVGDPWARVVYQQGLKPALDAIGPRMAVSIGLALRHIVQE